MGTSTGTIGSAPSPRSIDGAVDVAGRAFRLAEERGRVVVITVTSRYTHAESERLNARLAAECGPSVQLVSVVSMSGIPGMFRGYARGRVREAAAHHRTRFLVDDEGRIGDGLGARPGERVDILVLGPDGTVRARFAGERELGATLSLVRKLDEAAGIHVASAR
jgi:hypothetical protein